MARKGFPDCDIFEVLRLTSQSRASELRDRLFAVLGLIQHDGLQSQTLKPDYSLSAQHVYIGLFAHLIINLKMHRLFRYAAGFSAPASLPSWLPDWVTPESWQRIFKPWRSDSGELAEFITRNILPHANHSSEDGVRGFCWLFSREWKDVIFHKKPWNRDVIVDINTGALSINLIHLSTISSRPAIIQKRGRMNIFEVKGAKTCLYLAAEGLLESVSCLGLTTFL
jgi:hypothetical protein